MSGDTIESREARVRMEVREEAVLVSDQARRIALRDNIRDAQRAMASAGFAVADSTSPWDMVDHLLRRNADQQKLEDGLRERLKAAEGACLTIGAFSAAVVETLSKIAHDHGAHSKLLKEWSGECRRAASEALGWAQDTAKDGLKDYPHRACEIIEIVKNAEEDRGSAADGTGRPPQQPVAGGDRSNDPGSPR